MGAQELRDVIHKGDYVTVIHRGGGGRERRISARVTQVLRAAVEVLMPGESVPTTVPFKQLDLSTLPLAKKHALRKSQQPKTTTVEYVANPFGRPDPEDEPSADLEAWFAMGQEILEKMKGELRIKQEELAELEDQRSAIEAKIENAAIETDKLRNRIEKVRKMVTP